MAELESQILEQHLPIIDDPQIIDEQFGLSAGGGPIDLESFFMMRDILNQLPPHTNDWSVVRLEAYHDNQVNYTPLLKLAAGILGGIEAIDEEKDTVIVDFIHARAIAQLGVPFDIIELSEEQTSEVAIIGKNIQPSFEDSPMDVGYIRNTSDLPTTVKSGRNRSCTSSGPTSKPVFERQRKDIRSRKRGGSIL